MYVGYEMVIFIAGLQNIPEDLYEAARIDGASEWQVYWKITLPLLWPTVMVNVTLCIVGSLSAFQLIYVTTGGSAATRTLAMLIYQVAFGLSGGTANNAGRQGLASAMSMLLFVFILVITILSRRLMSRKED
jgi:ABC-type sugar transport system permease subunit